MIIDEKNAIVEIVARSMKTDYENSDMLADEVLEFETTSHANTIVGKRYITRLEDIVSGLNDDTTCVLCTKLPSKNKVVCATCQEQISALPADYEPDIRTLRDKKANKEHSRSGAAKTATSTGKRDNSRYNSYVDDLLKNIEANIDGLARQRNLRHVEKLVIVAISLGVVNLIGLFAVLFAIIGLYGV